MRIYVNVWCNTNVSLASLSLNIIIFLTEGSKRLWLIFWTDVQPLNLKTLQKNKNTFFYKLKVTSGVIIFITSTKNIDLLKINSL